MSVFRSHNRGRGSDVDHELFYDRPRVLKRAERTAKWQKENINISVIQTLVGELVSWLEAQRKASGAKGRRVSVPAMTTANEVSKHCQLVYLAAH